MIPQNNTLDKTKKIIFSGLPELFQFSGLPETLQFLQFFLLYSAKSELEGRMIAQNDTLDETTKIFIFSRLPELFQFSGLPEPLQILTIFGHFWLFSSHRST